MFNASPNHRLFMVSWMMMQRFKRRQTSVFRQRTPSVTDSSASSSTYKLVSISRKNVCGIPLKLSKMGS
jgi:hypothetical protein